MFKKCKWLYVKQKSISQFTMVRLEKTIFGLFVCCLMQTAYAFFVEIAVYGLKHIDDAYGGISSNGNNFATLNFTNDFSLSLVDNAATVGKPDGDNNENIVIRVKSDLRNESCSSG